jgi:hypothetical protein
MAATVSLVASFIVIDVMFLSRIEVVTLSRSAARLNYEDASGGSVQCRATAKGGTRPSSIIHHPSW